VNLTKRIVERLEPKAVDKIYFDDRLKGFGIRVAPTGRKAFIVQYRSGGRSRRYSLGLFGSLTCVCPAPL